MRTTTFALVLAALAAAAVNADEKGAKEHKPKGHKASNAHVLKGDVLWALSDSEKKLIQLAEAFPDDKWSYRPGEGVRSVPEVFLHVAGGNYFLASFLGAKKPESVPKDIEKSTTDRKAVIEALRESFKFVHAAVEAKSDADLLKPMKFFGHDVHEQTVLVALVAHSNEHLGQSIAYARANGVVPPWSKKGD